MKLKYLLLKLGFTLLRGIYAPMKLQKTKNRITILSRQDDIPSIDIKLLAEYYEKNYPKTEVPVLTRTIDTGLVSKIAYAFHMLRQMWSVAASKALVIDGYCITASVLNHKPELTIIQTWHSMAAIKKFGYQTIGKKGGHSKEIADIMRMHRNYDCVICPSEETGSFFCEGFDITPDKLKYMALPRLDYIKDSAKTKEIALNIKQKHDIIRDNPDREIILYAPTFRRDNNVKVKELLEVIDYNRYLPVISPHPLDCENYSRAVEEMGLADSVIIDSEISSFDWMKVCDRIITDYSAVAVESLVTGKPLYFYVYDISEYTEEVGINVNPLDEMPQSTAKTAEAMRKILEAPYNYEEYNRFKDKYLTADTNACTQKLAEYIVSEVLS